MAERKRIAIIEPEPEAVADGAIIPPESSRIWVPSGAKMSDLVLGGTRGAAAGGAYPLGTILNLVGDRSSGKTLLAVEALANFVATVGDVKHARYADAEAAFDDDYGDVLGMPKGVQTILPGEMETVEDFFADLTKFLDSIPPNTPSIYILDSLDALSDSAEMERELDKGSYGASKAKQMSQVFRRIVASLAVKNCLLIIISQVRDKIGVMFGEKHTRSGGRALDFFASQIVWLSEVGKLKKSAYGIERVIGIETRVRTKKNKVALAFRECELTIIFNYGIDDEISSLRWLKEAKAENALPEGLTLVALEKEIIQARIGNERDILSDLRGEINAAAASQWEKIEQKLAPPMRKYER